MLKYKHIYYLSLLTTVILSYGCGKSASRLDPQDNKKVYSAGTITSQINEPYPTNDTPYTDVFTKLESEGKLKDRIKIADLRNQIKYDSSLHTSTHLTNSTATAASNIHKGCSVIGDLPENKRVYGYVTFRPRYYKKLLECKVDERNYGTFWIQDETGGIMVIRDARTTPFNVGDFVSFEVIGVSGYKDSKYVIMYKDFRKEDVPRRAALYTQEVKTLADANSKLGEVITFNNLVIEEPATNYNFNSMCVYPEGTTVDCNEGYTNDKHMNISLDRGLAQGYPFDKEMKKGTVIDVTGPVDNNYGLMIPVISTGQLTIK